VGRLQRFGADPGEGLVKFGAIHPIVVSVIARVMRCRAAQLYDTSIPVWTLISKMLWDLVIRLRIATHWNILNT
jgi:hypothetical protein